MSQSSIAAMLICGLAVAAGGCATVTGPDSLVHLRVNDAPAENGKRLDMRFNEIQRDVDTSVVEVTFNSGGSVSSSMFVMRGVCMVLAARNENYVKPTPLDTGGHRYRLTFYALENDAPYITLPGRNGRPDRTRSDTLSRSLCGLVRLLT